VVACFTASELETSSLVYRLCNSSNTTGNSTRRTSEVTSQLPLFPIFPQCSRKTHSARLRHRYCQLTTAAQRNEADVWPDSWGCPSPNLLQAHWRRNSFKRDPFPPSAAGLGSYRLPAEYRPHFILYSPQPQFAFNEPLCNAA